MSAVKGHVVVITAVNDASGKIDETKSCGACVFFEKHVRLGLEEACRKAGLELVILNQQSMGKADINPKTPQVIKDTSGWFPKITYFTPANWQTVQRDLSKVVPFDIYNGEKDSAGKWKLKAQPQKLESIMEWALQKIGKSPAAKRAAPADPLDEIVIVGRRSRRRFFNN